MLQGLRLFLRRVNLPLLLCIAGLSAVTAWLGASFPRAVVDDAYIHARYAQNLAEHGQLAWNLDEDPVEGYTGVLMPLVYAAAFEAGFPFEAAVPVLGLACFWVTGLALILACRKEAAAAALVTLLYCLTPFLYRHVFSGMETGLFACLLALALAQAGAEFRPPSLPLFSLSLLLLALARPEGLLYAAAFAGGAIAAARNPRNASAWLLGLFVLPYAGYFAWRWGYYGYPLPNPYYVKAAPGWVRGSLEEIGGFLFRNSFTLPAASLLVLRLGLDFFKQAPSASISAGRAGRLRAGVVLAPLAVILVQYSRSSLSMNYSHRFLAAYYPLLLLAFGGLLEAVFRSYAGQPRLKTLLSLGAVLVCGGSLAVTFPGAYRAEWEDAGQSRRLIESEHIPLGKKLARSLPADETLVVLKDAGAVPYYAGLRTLDLGALNDEFLAHSQPGPEATLEYVFRSRPGVFVITSYDAALPDRESQGGDPRLLEQLLDDERFEAYTLVEVFHPPGDERQYFEFVYVRRDLVGRYNGYTQLFEGKFGTRKKSEVRT